MAPAGAVSPIFLPCRRSSKKGRRVINNIGTFSHTVPCKNIFSFVVSLVLLFAAMPLSAGARADQSAQRAAYRRSFVPADIRAILWACTRQLYAQRAAERTARRAGQCGEPAGCDVDRLRMGLPMEQISTVCTLLAGTAGFMVLLFCAGLCPDGALPSWPPWAWASSAHASCWGRCSALSPLSGRAWTLLGVFAAATPALMCLFVFLVSRVKQRLRRSQRAKHAAGLSATLPEAYFSSFHSALRLLKHMPEVGAYFLCPAPSAA